MAEGEDEAIVGEVVEIVEDEAVSRIDEKIMATTSHLKAILAMEQGIKVPHPRKPSAQEQHSHHHLLKSLKTPCMDSNHKVNIPFSNKAGPDSLHNHSNT